MLSIEYVRTFPRSNTNNGAVGWMARMNPYTGKQLHVIVISLNIVGKCQPRKKQRAKKKNDE
jgi:hypothetical protein